LSCSEREDKCHEFADFSFFKLLRLVVGSTAGKKIEEINKYGIRKLAISFESARIVASNKEIPD
jgi:hypothetical protein